jgi:hypothetical protein
MFTKGEEVNQKRLLMHPDTIIVSVAAWLFFSLLFCITLGLAAKGN